MPAKDFWCHVAQAAAIDTFHSHALYRHKYSEINHFQFHAFDVQLAIFIVNSGFGYHDILEFEVPMDDFAAVTIIDGVYQLDEELVCLVL